MDENGTDRRVLLVAYYFPPLGGAGVSRPLALARYLPHFGLNCDILTVKPVAYHIHEPDLLEGLDRPHVFRAGSHDPQRLLYLLGLRRSRSSSSSALRRLSARKFPDSKRGWIGPATRLGRRLCREAKYAAIISTSPPVSAHFIARHLAGQFGLPWIADFRDPWNAYDIESWFPKEDMRQRAWSFIDDVGKRAAGMVATNAITAEYLGCDHAIPNGYHPELAQKWPSPTDPSVFSIGLLGTIDELTPVEPLIDCLAAWRERASEQAKRIRIVQVGRCDPKRLRVNLNQALPEAEVVSHGLQPRSLVPGLLGEAVVLYMGLADTHRELTPGRFFEMLASGRRLLIAAPSESDVARIVKKTGCGLVFSPAHTDLSGPVDYLRQLADQWRDGRLIIEAEPDYARPYSHREVARRFADLIQRVADD